MTQHIHEGTPQELAPVLAKRSQGRFRLIELPDEAEPIEEALDAKLRLWQQQDGTPLLPDVPAHDAFRAVSGRRCPHDRRRARSRRPLVAGHASNEDLPRRTPAVCAIEGLKLRYDKTLEGAD